MKKGLIMSGILGSLTILLGIILIFGEQGFALGTCSVSFNSGMYVGASPCSLDKKMVQGEGDATISISILPSYGTGFTGSRSFSYTSYTGVALRNQSGGYIYDAVTMNGTGYYYSGTEVVTPVSGKIVNTKLTPGTYSGSVWITIYYGGTYKNLEIPLQIRVFASGCAKELNGTFYYLDPCSVSKTMEDGRGDEGYKFSLISTNTSKSYNFNLSSYSSGYPMNGNVCTPNTGNGFGQKNFMCFFSDEALSVGNYSGNLRIAISSSDGSGALYLQLKTTVVAPVSEIGCTAAIDQATFSLDPCSSELVFIDEKGRKDFEIKLNFSSGGNYSYSTNIYGSGFPQDSVGCENGTFGSYGNNVTIRCAIKDNYMGTGIYEGQIRIKVGENYGSSRYLLRNLKIVSVVPGTVIETPTNLQSVSGEVVYSGTKQQVKLTWDDNSLLEDYYEIYYSPNNKNSWGYYGNTPKNATGAMAYINMGQYSKHFFKVRARSYNYSLVSSDFSNIERFIDVTVPQ